MIDPIFLLNSLARVFDAVKTASFIQLIVVLLLCSLLFLIILLNSSKIIKLPAELPKLLGVISCCIIFPSLSIGAWVMATDVILFPVLFRTVLGL